MRFLKRKPAPTDPEAVRTRRRRRLRRRAAPFASALLVLAASSAGAGYLERQGWFEAARDAAQSRLAAAGSALHLTVASIEIEGRERAGREPILAALGAQRGSPIFGIDLDAAKARLEALPWIRAAAIERLLPDTLFIRIVERTPLAVWQHDGKFALIDQDGAVIPGANPAAFPALLQVVGAGAPKATPALLGLLASEPALRRHVTAAVRIGDRRWNVELDSGVEVDLPEDHADAAWHHLAALERSDHLLERAIVAIDLRLPDRVVLRLSPEIAKSLVKKSRSTGPST